MNKKLGISMSGGGVKALIYVGVLQALAESGIQPAVVGGLSGGSIVAGLVGMGIPPVTIFEILSRVHVSELLDLNPFDGVAILDREKVEQMFIQICGKKLIEDCLPKVIIFATDFDTEKQVVMTQGNLVQAMIASCALFPLLQPVVIDGERMIEGGYTTLYGANFFREAGADVVIGIDVDGFANVKMGGVADIIFKSFDSTIHKLGEYEQQLYPVDIEINNFNDDTGMFEFNKAGKRLMDIGYVKGKEMLPKIRAVLA